MCTITYLPLGKDSFILTANRDESRIRPTQPPAIEDRGEQKLLYPKDAIAGGTWICISNQNRVAALMNGAFERHEWKPPYRRSRGLVMLDLFDFETASDFFENYDFDGIEPFTMIVYDDMKLTEFRWDSKQKHLKQLDVTKPMIWSSAPLYPKTIREKRESWFQEWLQKVKEYKPKEIFDFHKFGGEGDQENDFVMNRYDIVQTVSITSVVKETTRAAVHYQDLIAGSETEMEIPINRERKVQAH